MLAAAFDRLARTVRHAVALARKLSEPDREPRAAAQQGAPPRVSKAIRTALQRRIAGDPDAYARLSDAELDDIDDYLDDLDRRCGYRTLPLPDQIALIRRDLGFADLPGTSTPTVTRPTAGTTVPPPPPGTGPPFP